MSRKIKQHFDRIDGQIEMFPDRDGNLNLREYHKPDDPPSLSALASLKAKPTDYTAVSRLYNSWRYFLDIVSKYAQKYYLYNDILEEKPSKESLAVLEKYFKGDPEQLRQATMNQEDLAKKFLQNISDCQKDCGLDPISGSRENRDRIISNFVLIDKGARERREFFRKRVAAKRRERNPEALSLTDLEKAFKEKASS